MNLGRYLPTRQFSLIAVSLFLSAGLVFAADRVISPKTTGSLVVDTQRIQVPAATDWQASLDSVQTESGVSLPEAPDPTTVNGLLEAAKSANVTDTVSRSLFINLVNAKGQGLGSDIPTQDQLINGAISQIDSTAPAKQYSTGDLTFSDNTSASLHDYGNKVMSIFLDESDQEFMKTMAIIDAATTQNDPKQLALLKPIQKKYQAIANALAEVPVPKTLSPFHMQLVNDYGKMAATYDNMQLLISDPIAALAAIQQYNSIAKDAGQMFINIAQTLGKNDILFTKDEPGATWALLLQPQ